MRQKEVQNLKFLYFAKKNAKYPFSFPEFCHLKYLQDFKLRKRQQFKKSSRNCKFLHAKICDTNILRNILLSSKTIQYPYLKPEIVSLAQKDP